MTSTPKRISAEKPNYRRFQDPKDKPFYAAYLNTAKQNVFIVLREISEKLRLGFNHKSDDRMLDDSNQIWSKLKENLEPEVCQKIIERLNEQFTFLKYLALNEAHNTHYEEREPTPEDYYNVLQRWINQLLDYRNFYSHAEHKPISLSSEVIDAMRLLFDADLAEFKKRYALDTEHVNHLIRLGKDGERRDFKYGFTDNKGLTEKGFLYFVSLWLEKKKPKKC